MRALPRTRLRAALSVLLGALAACGSRTELRVSVLPSDAALAPDAPAADAAPDTAPDVAPRDASDVVLSPRCGDGVLSSGEQCDLGAANADVPAFAVRQAGVERPVTLRGGRQSAVGFYAYRSASAHTGLEQVTSSNMLLHVDTLTQQHLSLVLFTGRDDDGSGATAQPDSAIVLTVRDVPAGVSVLLSDDGGEFVAAGPGVFRGDWTFNRNTDGGVLGFLPWDTEWTVRVEPTFMRGVSVWQYYSGVGAPLTLQPTAPAELVHRVRNAGCRADCRLPRCGDGYVDAGERCDDGNVLSGDGCRGDCGALQ